MNSENNLPDYFLVYGRSEKTGRFFVAVTKTPA